VEQRFFCHQCSVEIPRVAADFTCPTCNSGFIEELGQDAAPPVPPAEGPFHHADDDPFDHLGQVLGPLETLLPGLLGRGVGPVGGLAPRPMGPRAGLRPRIRIARGGSRPQHLGMDQAALETALQDFIVNLAGMEFGAGAHPGLQGGAPGGAQFHFVNPGAGGGLGVQLHGNPGDYAWGRGGLDAIITQLLNHMDGTGPPPMAKENIADIPTVEISSQMREKNSSCSVCWEDFSDGESVKQLECEHCFHSGCIVPWLELHGTCPVCRKELGRTATAPGSDSASTPDPPTPHLDEASGGFPVGEGGAGSNSQRRASVTVSGTGGLTGLIQSALNQVFASSWTGSSTGGEGGSSSSSSSDSSRSPSDSNNPATSSHPSGQSGSSSSTGQTSSSSSSSQQQTRSPPESQEDEGTPATRRPRLDSEFVDLDFD